MKPVHLETLRHELEQQTWLPEFADLMNAAGSDTRARILYVLWREHEVRVNDIAEVLDLTTPAISQQLKKLRHSDVVRTRREAQTVYYRLNDNSPLCDYLCSFFHRESSVSA